MTTASDGPSPDPTAARDGVTPGTVDDLGATGKESSESTDPRPPATPALAHELFGSRLALAEHYVALLADTGISHGLVGPRERPRLWDRHVLGCALVTDLVPADSRVIDVGSGAGLPGLVMAIRRPDLHLQLVEPLHRRVVWLEEAVDAMGLRNVTVTEGRAESCWGGPRVDVVTARAVARIGVLAAWTLPLLRARGRLVALKGSSVATEIEHDEADLRAAGAAGWEVAQLGEGMLDPPTTVVSVRVGDQEVGSGKRAANRRVTGTAGSARRRRDRPKR